MTIKKFKEFVTEAKRVDADDHHEEAVAIIKKHKHGAHLSHDHVKGEHKMTYSAVHPKHVEKLHADLKAAGFEHTGNTGLGQSKRNNAHNFKKGKTEVAVSHHPDMYKKNEGDKEDHHAIEAFTDHKGKSVNEETLDEAAKFRQFVAEATKTVKTGDVIMVNGKFAGYHGKVSGRGEHKVESHASALRKAKKAHGPDNHIEFMDFDEYQKKKSVKEEVLDEAAYKRAINSKSVHMHVTEMGEGDAGETGHLISVAKLDRNLQDLPKKHAGKVYRPKTRDELHSKLKELHKDGFKIPSKFNHLTKD